MTARNWLGAVFAPAGLLTLAACSATEPTSPEVAAEEFVAAASDHDYERLCDLSKPDLMDGDAEDCRSEWKDALDVLDVSEGFATDKVRIDDPEDSDGDWQNVNVDIPGVGTFVLQYDDGADSDDLYLLRGYSFES